MRAVPASSSAAIALKASPSCRTSVVPEGVTRVFRRPARTPSAALSSARSGAATERAVRSPTRSASAATTTAMMVAIRFWSATGWSAAAALSSTTSAQPI